MIACTAMVPFGLTSVITYALSVAAIVITGVVLIQGYRDTAAIHAKLDEIIVALKETRNNASSGWNTPSLRKSRPIWRGSKWKRRRPIKKLSRRGSPAPERYCGSQAKCAGSGKRKTGRGHMPAAGYRCDRCAGGSDIGLFANILYASSN